jgi:hypothetical protein
MGKTFKAPIKDIFYDFEQEHVVFNSIAQVCIFKFFFHIGVYFSMNFWGL